METRYAHALKILTGLLALVFVLIICVGSLTPGGDFGWLEVIQLVVAPFELLALLVLWAIYFGTRPQKPDRHKGPAPKSIPSLSKILSVLSVAIGSFGALLLIWFGLSHGPNGTHLFKVSANPYIDLQIGCGCLLVASLLAIGNYYYRRPR